MREKIDLFLPCEYIDDAQNALSVLHEYKTVQHIHFLVSADFAAHHQVPKDVRLSSPTAWKAVTPLSASLKIQMPTT